MGLGVQDPGHRGLVRKVGVINEGQGVKVCNIVWIFVLLFTQLRDVKALICSHNRESYWDDG